MKTLIRTSILFFYITGLASCYVGTLPRSEKSENNQTYKVSCLFEHDGVKVCHFFGLGDYMYFTIRGDVTSIKNDLTRKRAITIYKDSMPSRQRERAVQQISFQQLYFYQVDSDRLCTVDYPYVKKQDLQCYLY